MKFINKFLIGLMALAVATAILAFCLDQTLLKADFVTTQADKSGIYNDLAKQLPKQLAGDGETSPTIQTALERVVTPEYLQSKFDTYIHNLDTAFKSGAAIPPLDLTSLITQAEAQGVVLSASDKAQLTKNLTIDISNPGGNSSDAASSATNPSQKPQFAKTYRKISAGKWLLIGSALLLSLLVFLTAPHHRLKALGHGFIGATLWLLGYYVFFRLAPGIATHQLKTAKDFNLSGSVSQLITLAASGVAQRLLYAAIATAAVGVVLWVMSLFMPHFGTGHGKDKGEKRTPLPTVFHKD